MSAGPAGVIKYRAVAAGAAAFCALVLPNSVLSQISSASDDIQPRGEIASQINAVERRVIEWRRAIHKLPELGNREFKTAELVAGHLRNLGFEVRTGVGHTGVVGILDSGRKGATILLRADMDALPVKELTGLPFASTVETQYNGARVPVMHACGHDAHVAMLMGAAEVLAAMKGSLRGKVIVVFQPAEEGPPPGEEGGAALMIKEGALDGHNPDAVFALHVVPGPTGHLRWRPRGMLTGADGMIIRLTGRQTHGSMPWVGIDMASMTADIIQGMNTVAARQVDLSVAPGLITIAMIHGGVRGNIIPESLEMQGTIRSLDDGNRARLKDRARDVVAKISALYGAQGEIEFHTPYPITYNNPALAKALAPALARAANGHIDEASTPLMPSEDFSHFTDADSPGLYVLLGASPASSDWRQAAPNHSPHFAIDESVLRVGVRAHVEVALHILSSGYPRPTKN